MVRRIPGWALALALLTVVTLVYLPTFGNGFTYDDHSMIEGNPNLRPGGSWRALLGQSLYGHFADRGATLDYWRPALYVVYRLAYSVGGGAPWAFHLAGLLLHLGCTALAGFTLRAMGLSRGQALAGAALFALHPLAAEAVYWAPGINDQLMLAATLLALCSGIAVRSAGGMRRVLLHLGMALAVLLGLFAKETAIIIAPLLVVEAWLANAPKSSAASRLLTTLPAWIASALWLALRVVMLPPGTADGVRPELLWSVGRAGRALLWNAKKLVIPWPLTTVHEFPLHPATGWFDWLAATGFVLLLAVVLWAVVLRRPGSWWAAWMLLPTLPALFHFFGSTRVLSNVVVAERYVYPALVPFLACLVRASGALPRRVALALLAVACVIGGLTVHRYGPAFRDDGALFGHAYRYNPDSVFVLNQLATQHLRDGHPAQALPLLDRALVIEPESSVPRLNRASSLLALGRAAEAVADFESAHASGPVTPGMLAQFGDALAAAGREEEAARRWTEAAERDAGNVAVRASLGNLFWRRGQREAALVAWREALAIAPDEPGLLFNLGLGWIETGHPEYGRPLLQRFLALTPATPGPQRDAAMAAMDATTATP